MIPWGYPPPSLQSPVDLILHSYSKDLFYSSIYSDLFCYLLLLVILILWLPLPYLGRGLPIFWNFLNPFSIHEGQFAVIPRKICECSKGMAVGCCGDLGESWVVKVFCTPSVIPCLFEQFSIFTLSGKIGGWISLKHWFDLICVRNVL